VLRYNTPTTADMSISVPQIGAEPFVSHNYKIFKGATIPKLTPNVRRSFHLESSLPCTLT
jgi:hypothetical protein